MRLVDTHAHLNEFSDLDNVLEGAKASEVTAIVAVGMDHESNVKTLEYSKLYKGYVYPALGVHPWRIKESVEEAVGFIKQNIDRCVAIGEIGLDYWIKTDQETQKLVYKDLLNLAVGENKAVCVHARGAWEDAYDLVKESRVKKAVFHWYSGPLEVLQRILDSGYFVSATPAAEYSKHHREALQHTPLENILLETDSPVKYKGVDSEPSHVYKTLKYVAEIKGVSEEILAEKTTENAIELFNLPI